MTASHPLGYLWGFEMTKSENGRRQLQDETLELIGGPRALRLFLWKHGHRWKDRSEVQSISLVSAELVRLGHPEGKKQDARSHVVALAHVIQAANRAAAKEAKDQRSRSWLASIGVR